jgi:two-component system chemotaxis response regulator CheY
MQSHDVLVVDDDRDLRSALALMLEAEGHTVVEAEHGLHALEIMKGSTPHLIILDLTMPVMDGRTFLEHKAQGAHASTPVVVFSSTPAAEIESMPSVESVVHKLAGVDALTSAIRKAIAKLAHVAPSPPPAYERLEKQLLGLGLLDSLLARPCSSCSRRVPLFPHLAPPVCLGCLGRSRGFVFGNAL